MADSTGIVRLMGEAARELTRGGRDLVPQAPSVCRRCHPTRRAGMTLIEMATVITIMGILAAIAWPRFNSMQLRWRVSAR